MFLVGSFCLFKLFPVYPFFLCTLDLVCWVYQVLLFCLTCFVVCLQLTSASEQWLYFLFVELFFVMIIWSTKNFYMTFAFSLVSIYLSYLVVNRMVLFFSSMFYSVLQILGIPGLVLLCSHAVYIEGWGVVTCIAISHYYYFLISP